MLSWPLITSVESTLVIAWEDLVVASGWQPAPRLAFRDFDSLVFLLLNSVATPSPLRRWLDTQSHQKTCK